MTRHITNTIPFTLLLLLVAGLLLQACSSAPEGIAVGAQAPDFTLPSSEGTQVSLSDYTGEQPVLLFFHMANG
jgi:peroxiredoxin Q/BCP